MDLQERMAHTRARYDNLAQSYANNVGIHREVMAGIVDWFANYVKPGSSVLEVGPGVGLATSLLCDKGYVVTAIELSHVMAAHATLAAPAAEVVIADFFSHPVDKQYDSVFACAFLHLYERHTAADALRKMHACLRPDGYAYVSVPRAENGTLRVEANHAGDLPYVKYTREALEKLLRDCSFAPVSSCTTPDSCRVGMLWTNNISRKRAPLPTTA